MVATFDVMTNAELNEIAQEKTPRLIENRPIFDILPLRDVDASQVMWEQKDNFRGLQQLRGYNGQPPKVQMPGANRFIVEPGVYGEQTSLDERTLVERRRLGSWGAPMSLDDLVMDGQDLLLGRRLDRIEWVGWTLLTTGTFVVLLPNGAAGHRDTYALQSYTAPVAWGTSGTSRPLNDFRNIKIQGRGKGASFGQQATAYMNEVTVNQMLANTNSADIFGRRTGGLATVATLGEINVLLAGEGLPQIVAYDEGFLDELSGNYIPYIGDGVVTVVGKRPAGQKIGEFQMTRNAQNPNSAPGPYQRIINKTEDEGVPEIQIHDGCNGGPAIFYPGSIIVMTVG